LLLAVVPALWALDNELQQDKSAREQYKSIVDAYQKQQNDFMTLLREAKTIEEQKKALEKRPDQEKLVKQMMEVAEKNAKDPVAFDALLWVVNNGPGTKESTQALAVITSDHLSNPRLGEAFPSLIRTPGADKLLQTALEKNTNRDVQGLACFYLAQNLKSKSDLATRQKKSDEAAALIKQAEAYFERVAKEFGDVKSGKSTLAEATEPELFEIRFLSVGKTAPDIVADDLDGKSFKLSDYRGKVILLDFWGHW
jgi:bacterioferritin (cytochrome b1)